MPDTSSDDFYVQQAKEAREPDGSAPPQKRHQMLKRLALTSGATIVALVAAVAGGGYMWANHEAGSVQRIQVAALDAKDQAAFADGRPGSLNILLTASGLVPAPGRSDRPDRADPPQCAISRAGRSYRSRRISLSGVPGHGKHTARRNPGARRALPDDRHRRAPHRRPHRALFADHAYPGLPKVVGSMGCVVRQRALSDHELRHPFPRRA